MGEKSPSLVTRSCADAPLVKGDQLTPAGEKLLVECEEIVQRDLHSFLAVGAALATIRNGKLYRITHLNFETYCRERFDITIRRAQQVLQASAAAVRIREANTCSRLPETEGQIRPLVSLPAPKQAEAWKEAVESAENGDITSRHVARIARAYKPKQRYQPGPSAKWLPKDSTEKERRKFDHLFKTFASCNAPVRTGFLKYLATLQTSQKPGATA